MGGRLEGSGRAGHSHAHSGKGNAGLGAGVLSLQTRSLSPTSPHTPSAPSHLGAGGSPTAGPGASWWAQDTQEHTRVNWERLLGAHEL